MVTAAQNPFRTSRLHGLEYCLDGISWEDLLARLESMNHRAAIIGAHGCGKSTLLQAVGNKLEEQGLFTLRLFLNESRKRLDSRVSKNVHENTVVLLDGAEQLNALAWRGFLWRIRAAKGVVITCHRPMRLPVLHECSTSPVLLDRLLDALHPGAAPEERAAAHALFLRHHGNLREVFLALYDRHMHGFP